MSNLGLETHLKSIGLTLERSQMGDRYVVQRMRKERYNLGGEQSGHIVMSDYATAGDGLMASLQVLAVMVKTGKPRPRSGTCLSQFRKSTSMYGLRVPSRSRRPW
jgi:phosphoglucosamine mutase